MAVDGNEATYWASKFDDTKEPVALTIDLGGKSNIQDMRIDWEFPAKAFTVLVSIDGKKFAEAYSTDVNALKSSRLPIGRSASAVKIVMREPHAARGRFEGHTLYGIASVSVFANQLETVVEKCTIAAKSKDARDKFFLSRVASFDPVSGRALENELPSLEVIAQPLCPLFQLSSATCTYAGRKVSTRPSSNRTFRDNATASILPSRGQPPELRKASLKHISKYKPIPTSRHWPSTMIVISRMANSFSTDASRTGKCAGASGNGRE